MSTPVKQPLLDTLTPPPESDPAWLSSLRSQAIERLQSEGLPTKRHEAWRFTNPKTITQTGFAPQDSTGEISLDPALLMSEGDKVFVFSPDGSPILFGLPEVPGLHIESLRDVLRDEPEKLEGLLRAEGHGPFGDLNTALFRDGLVVFIDANTEVQETIEVMHVTSGAVDATAGYPRVLFVLGANAKASFIEIFEHKEFGDSAHLTNALTEVVLGQGAKLDHTRVRSGGWDHHIARLAVRQGRDSSYQGRFVTLGGKLTRLDIDVRFEGPGAECNLDGGYHAMDEEHVDHQVSVKHSSSHCTSHQRFRGVIDGRATAVFNGMAFVEHGTKGSAAHQENRNLLLSDDATVHTKPHLEIDADDVTASHGATVGALDEQALFFLRARGIGEEDARAMLTLAFVRGAIDEVPDDDLRERLLRQLSRRMGAQHISEELTS